MGGPRFILAGDTGTYSVSLQNLGNINAPYVEFNVGIPQLSNAEPTNPSDPNIADPVNVNLDDLPYVEVDTDLGGEPPDRAWTRRCRTPRSSLRQTPLRATAISRCRATFSTRPLAALRSSRLTSRLIPVWKRRTTRTSTRSRPRSMLRSQRMRKREF